MKPPPGISYDTVRRTALTLPHVEEGASYGTPALKVKGKLLVRLRSDPDALVVRMPFDQREELLASDPETYFITAHYRNYPWVLVRLTHLHPDALPGLLRMAHRAATAPERRRSRPRPAP